MGGTNSFGFDSGDEDSVEERADCSDVSGGRQLAGLAFNWHTRGDTIAGYGVDGMEVSTGG